MNQIERSLHKEISVRLKAAKPACVWISPPNGLFIPTRSDAERSLVRRIIHRMKLDGMITPGASDFIFLWEYGCGCVELKRPATKTVLGTLAKGRLSNDQITFKEACDLLGVPYVIATCWEDVQGALKRWGLWR